MSKKQPKQNQKNTLLNYMTSTPQFQQRQQQFNPTPQEKMEGEEIPKEKQEKKALFKSLFSQPQLTSWDEGRLIHFEKLLSNQIQMPPLMIENISDKSAGIESEEVIRPRRIHLYLSDSLKSYKGAIFTKTSTIIRPKHPFSKDENQIEYDLDTEDERQGESISQSIKNDEDEEDDMSESDEKFVVPDGYLSEEEVSVSEKENVHKEIKPLQSLPSEQNKVQPYQICLKPLQNVEELQDQNLKGYLLVTLANDVIFPIQKKEKIDTKCSFLENAQNIKIFISYVHGSYASIKSIANYMKDNFDQCSKNSVEKKLKEIAEKKRIDQQKQDRWFIKQEILDQFGFTGEQSAKLISDCFADFQAKKQQENEKKKEEQERKREEEKINQEANTEKKPEIITAGEDKPNSKENSGQKQLKILNFIPQKTEKKENIIFTDRKQTPPNSVVKKIRKRKSPKLDENKEFQNNLQLLPEIKKDQMEQE